MSKRDVADLKKIRSLLEEANRIASFDLAPHIRRSIPVALKDLDRALEGFDSQYQLEYVASYNELAPEDR